MKIWVTKIEKDFKDRVEGIFDIEDYEGVKVEGFKNLWYNLNENKTYRIDLKNRVLFWENNEIKEIPSWI